MVQPHLGQGAFFESFRHVQTGVCFAFLVSAFVVIVCNAFYILNHSDLCLFLLHKHAPMYVQYLILDQDARFAASLLQESLRGVWVSFAFTFSCALLLVGKQKKSYNGTVQMCLQHVPACSLHKKEGKQWKQTIRIITKKIKHRFKQCTPNLNAT